MSINEETSEQVEDNKTELADVNEQHGAPHGEVVDHDGQIEDHRTELSEVNVQAPHCPVVHGHQVHPTQGDANSNWWPDRLNLKILAKNPSVINPYGEEFDYAAAFEALDLAEVKQTIEEVLTTSQDWWPADWGHYGPMIIRMAWHSAGTYRVQDGRGGGGTGQQRFAPLNSWPDNVGLDRARRLLWPVKKKYGKSLSWGDLMILAGNVALESMGFKTFGFGGGRADVWEPDADVYWGPETEWLADARYRDEERELYNPLAAVQMGLIYVNPEGPLGEPDPMKSAQDIRDTFARMAMNDEETVALIAGGHTFGKTHGAADPGKYVGPEPEAAPLEQMGLGWKGSYNSGKGNDTIFSGLEVIWNNTPTTWDNNFFWTLFGYEWELTTSPAGASQWQPKGGAGANTVKDPHGTERTRTPNMLTSDIALRTDPEYEKISRRYLENPNEFADAFARAWFKLTHRDMGPISRYLGPEVPSEVLIWQDPVPANELGSSAEDIAEAKALIAGLDLSVQQLVKTAWAAAASYRDSDKRGGVNGGRIRLEPQRSWEVNEPAELSTVIEKLESIQDKVNVSFADLVVLAGNVGVEQAAAAAGVEVEVPFTPGRGDATQEETEVDSFAWLEPKWDGFRNYERSDNPLPAEYLLVDKANQLGLSAPQMTVLVGGLRALGANTGGSDAGVFTDRVGTLTNDFFVNLLDMNTSWTAEEGSDSFVGTSSDGHTWSASRADMVFGSNSELRAVAEVYASDDAAEKFVHDFVAAWAKVMDNDRFDVKK